MNIKERIEAEIKEFCLRNDDSIGSDSILIALTLAICFDALIEQLAIMNTDY